MGNSKKLTLSVFISTLFLLIACSRSFIDHNFIKTLDKTIKTTVFSFKSHHKGIGSGAGIAGGIIGLLTLGAIESVAKTNREEYLNNLDKKVYFKIEQILKQNANFHYQPAKNSFSQLKINDNDHLKKFFAENDYELALSVKVYYDLWTDEAFFPWNTKRYLWMYVYWTFYDNKGKEKTIIETSAKSKDEIERPWNTYDPKYQEDYIYLVEKNTEDFIAQLNKAIQEKVNGSDVTLQQ